MTYLNALPQSLVTTLNLADRVATCTTAAADRAITVWSFLTQPQAMQTYRWLSRMALALVHLAWVCAYWLYFQVKQWVDVEVYLATPIKADVFLATTAEQFAQFDEDSNQRRVDYFEEISSLCLDVDLMSIEEINNHPLRKDLKEIIRVKQNQFQVFKKLTNPPAQAQAMTAPIATLRQAPSTSHEDGLDREYELADMTLKQLVPIAAALNIPTRKVKKADLIDSIVHAEGYEV